MVKRIKKSFKSKSYNLSKTKNKVKLSPIKENRRKIRKKKLYEKNEYITDLSFIDKYEKDEQERIKIKENENLMKIQNHKLYTLKICYRPSTNNIELIGQYIDDEGMNDINKINNNLINCLVNNKCSYLLIQDNDIVAPILNEEIINMDNKKDNEKNKEINITNKKEKADNLKNIKNSRNKKKYKNKITNLKNKNKQFLYVHISKKKYNFFTFIK